MWWILQENEDTVLTTSSIFGSAKATQEADNVILLQDKRIQSFKGKKYIQVRLKCVKGEIVLFRGHTWMVQYQHENNVSIQCLKVCISIFFFYAKIFAVVLHLEIKLKTRWAITGSLNPLVFQYHCLVDMSNTYLVSIW